MEDKIKFELEFPIHASPGMLFQYLTETSYLDEWFADEVNSKEDIYTFSWGENEEKARLINYSTNEFVKFRWLTSEPENPDEYFEIRIQVDALTKDVALIVTDFATADELDEQKLFWEELITELKHTIGAG
jgi:uncharacterized protein YndB with AHSA1/START domain